LRRGEPFLHNPGGGGKMSGLLFEQLPPQRSEPVVTPATAVDNLLMILLDKPFGPQTVERSI
jgi:hypothetical protein